MARGNTLVVTKQVPLTTLLSRVWIAQTIETDNAFEAQAPSKSVTTSGSRCHYGPTACG
jgi:hypothetical protein